MLLVQVYEPKMVDIWNLKLLKNIFDKFTANCILIKAEIFYTLLIGRWYHTGTTFDLIPAILLNAIILLVASFPG